MCLNGSRSIFTQVTYFKWKSENLSIKISLLSYSLYLPIRSTCYKRMVDLCCLLVSGWVVGSISDEAMGQNY